MQHSKEIIHKHRCTYNGSYSFINKCLHEHFQTHPAWPSLRRCSRWFSSYLTFQLPDIPALMYKARTHLKANPIADDGTVKPCQERKSRPKSVLLPQFSTPRGFSPFSLQLSFPLRLPPFLQERNFPFILTGMDVTTMKGIVCPRPLLNQGCAHQSNSMKVSLCLRQLHPGRVWKMLISVTSCEAACAWISSPCSFCSLSKIQLKFLSKIIFSLCCPAVKHFYLLSNRSLPLRVRNTDESL